MPCTRQVTALIQRVLVDAKGARGVAGRDTVDFLDLEAPAARAPEDGLFQQAAGQVAARLYNRNR